jgi:hypothetical protein
MSLRFSRKQELYLIDLGLAALLDKALQKGHAPVKEAGPKKQKNKWSEAQRRKFKATMKRVWKEKRAKANG